MQRMLQNGGEKNAQQRIYTLNPLQDFPSYSAMQLHREYRECNNSPERCNLNGCPALSPEPFLAGAPAPACACLNQGAAGDSSPTGPSGPLSAGMVARMFE